MNIEQQVQRIWPDWEIVRRIGEGSFGTVYKARRRDIVGVTYAAIKVTTIPQSDSELEALKSEGFTPEQSDSYLKGIVRGLAAEIRMMEAVKGRTNIVNIEDYKVVRLPDKPQWQIFIRMELLTPLEQLGPLTEAQVVRLGMDLCTALSVCRRNNIVHRDIKPENIFANGDGDFKLGDFGVARKLECLTTGITRKGTYNYMAPEVFKGKLSVGDIDTVAKVDIYSLGIVLYRLMNNNRLPFILLDKLPTPKDRKDAILRRMSGEPLPPPVQASEGLAKVILKACAFDPAERYASAEDMRDELSRLACEAPIRKTPGETPVPPSEEPDPLPEQDAPKRARKGKRQGRAGLAAIIAALALLLVGGIAWRTLRSGNTAGDRPHTDVVVTQPAGSVTPDESEEEASAGATSVTAGPVENGQGDPAFSAWTVRKPDSYVRIIGDTIRVRLTPGTGTDVILNPQDGAMFRYLNHYDYDSRGVAYYYISTDQGPGYVTSAHTEIVDETGAYAEMDFMGKAVLAETDLPVRSEPDSEASILTLVPKKEKAKYLREYRRTDSGNKWYRVEYDGVSGWVWGLLCAMTIYE